MGRPRKQGPRKPCGRLKQAKREDPHEQVVGQRLKHTGVRVWEAKSPLGTFAAGVLYLRKQITLVDLGRYFSFLQCLPSGVRSGAITEKISGVQSEHGLIVGQSYQTAIKLLGRDIEKLHALREDRLICTLDELRDVLGKLPLTTSAVGFMNQVERWHPDLAGRSLLTVRQPVLRGGFRALAAGWARFDGEELDERIGRVIDWANKHGGLRKDEAFVFKKMIDAAASTTRLDRQPLNAVACNTQR